jgi:chemotaxis protein MotB
MSQGGDDEIHEEHEEHVNHEAWVIPYADLLTLLMAMFIALFAMSTVDVTKFKAFAIGFNEALGGGKIDAGIGGSGKATSPVVGAGNGNGPFSGGEITPQDQVTNGTQLQQILTAMASTKAAGLSQHQTLEDVRQQITAAADHLGLGGKVQTKELNNGLQVTLLTDQILFQSGQAQLEAPGRRLLEVIGEVLKPITNSIQINGYTDNVPIGPGGQFPSNLFLSSFRADVVAEYFESLGIDRARLFPAGRGDQDFVASNATAAGRGENRRVEIVVESNLVKQTLDNAGLNSQPATPSASISPIDKSSTAAPNLQPNLGGN